jgi:decaprenylphospho-beta-D-ribofuranose 2-oxidase
VKTNWVPRDIEGWGRYPVVEALVARPERLSEIHAALDDRENDAVLAHGLGRSYGDVATLKGGRVILTSRLNRMLAFDESTGWLRCEAGVSIKEIIDTFVPRGFFPPVVPGTQFVTVGGALANNIHGKNHHVDGCWGDHVRRVELLLSSGEVVVCDKNIQPELFWATVGGIGLTGLILSMEVQLINIENRYIEMESIRVNNLDEFFEVSAESAGFTHTVSWIDCVKTGKNMGRGIFMRGRHAAAEVKAPVGTLDRMSSFVQGLADGRPLHSNHLLNRATITLFNEAFFRKTPAGLSSAVTDYIPFFFPLDAVDHWNYVYGSRGFLQYQMVVPSREAVRDILKIISESGMASFLAVIKEFGDLDHGGLSFPTKGITLALDFPNFGMPLLEMLERLDAITVSVGGRVYLGKDARLSKASFRQMYGEWEKWKEVRDKWDPEHVFQSDLGRRLGLSGE